MNLSVLRATKPFARAGIPLLIMATGLAGGCSQSRPNLRDEAQLASASQPISRTPASIIVEQPSQWGLLPPQPFEALHTLSPLPEGWQPDPPKHSTEHEHQAWISPTRRTAYGVITFHHWLLPIASDRLVLDKFLNTMRASEGEARLVGMPWHDRKADGLRFVAEGGLYTVRGLLVTQGTRGWVVYAGTLRNQPVAPDELQLAERARDQTVPGIESQAGVGMD
jgi:hypothetical protein